MNTDLKRTSKNDFEKDFSGWWIIQFLVKLWKIFKFIGALNLKQQKKKETIWCQNVTNILQSFHRKFIKMRNIQTLMKKPVYLGFSMLDLGKTVMCAFWNDYGRPKYSKKAKFVIWI